MLLNIVLEDNTKDYDKMYEQVAEPIHNSLAGNRDYVDSNIVLHFDELPVKGKEDTGETYASCDLCFCANDIKDKELIRAKAKAAIDIFIDSLEK